MSVLFAAGVNGAAANVTDYNNNWNLLEGSFADLGRYLISGLAVTSGAGLAVSVAAGVASIGGRVTAAGSFSIAGLTPSTTNHLYLLQNGAGTANTTGTQPALSVKLGTCVTGVAAVTSVSQTRSSGCQQQVRSENLIPGGPGGGHPASINLAGWAAAAGDGVPVFGVLPAGAIPTAGVTAAKLSANMALRTPDKPAGAITTTVGTEVLLNCEVAGTINALAFVAKDALPASDTAFVSFGVINKQSGAGAGVVVDITAAANTTKATGGHAIVAYTHLFLTIGAAPVVAAGDLLVLSATVTGTLANPVTEGLWVVNIVPSS